MCTYSTYHRPSFNPLTITILHIISILWQIDFSNLPNIGIRILIGYRPSIEYFINHWAPEISENSWFVINKINFYISIFDHH